MIDVNANMNQELKRLMFDLQTFIARHYAEVDAWDREGNWAPFSLLTRIQNELDKFVYDEDGLDMTISQFTKEWQDVNS